MRHPDVHRRLVVPLPALDAQPRQLDRLVTIRPVVPRHARWTKLAPGPAMAWRDYVDSVAYADSGAASVMTVEAIRGSEPRVRAVAIELMSPTLSATDRPVLIAELYRWCSGAWTLVGQERAEDRLLDELDDVPGPG